MVEQILHHRRIDCNEMGRLSAIDQAQVECLEVDSSFPLFFFDLFFSVQPGFDASDFASASGKSLDCDTIVIWFTRVSSH